jgi:hypothetical protein
MVRSPLSRSEAGVSNHGHDHDHVIRLRLVGPR